MSESKQSCLTHYESAHKKFIGLKRDFEVLFYADGLRDIWTAFEAFMNFKGHKGKPWQKIRDFSKDTINIDAFSTWKKTRVFNECVDLLKKESPVENEENGKLIHLNNSDNLQELLVFTYVPRGNQIHGAKDITLEGSQGQRNKNLVEHSFKVVHEILQLFLQKEGLVN